MLSGKRFTMLSPSPSVNVRLPPTFSTGEVMFTVSSPVVPVTRKSPFTFSRSAWTVVVLLPAPPSNWILPSTFTAPAPKMESSSFSVPASKTIARPSAALPMVKLPPPFSARRSSPAPPVKTIPLVIEVVPPLTNN